MSEASSILAGFSSQKTKPWINTSWRNKPEYGFVVAHEMGHLIGGDEGINRYSSPRSQLRMSTLLMFYGVKLIKTMLADRILKLTIKRLFANIWNPVSSWI